MNLAVCNTVVPSTDPITQEVQYQVRRRMPRVACACGRVLAALGADIAPRRLRLCSAYGSMPCADQRRRTVLPSPFCPCKRPIAIHHILHCASLTLGSSPPPPQASSPDEEALVQGAAYLGYRLVSRSTEAVTVSWGGRLWNYDVLAVLEFNSDR